MKIIFLILLLVSGPSILADQLREALESSDRKAENVIRDIYRSPYETITFFKIKPNMKVIELSPGGGWYTEILANYLNDSGLLIAAHFNPEIKNNYLKRSRANFENMLSSKENFKKVKLVNLDSALAPTESVDAVLTFRNLHNWLGPNMDNIFQNSFNALKPGGYFGIVEHRAKPGTSLQEMKESGYVTESHAIKVAENNGFTLVGKSEINANLNDNTNHPKGVWTLPPTLRLKEVDKSKYLQIGESDRMTLLFMKPKRL
tara:strand:+ start:171 stop:950 length:780 start_codon:yes stop_codon:yes gene_type:complete